MKNLNIKILLFLVVNLFYSGISAQLNNAPQPTLESPYNTIYIHLYYLQPETYLPGIASKALPPHLDSISAVKKAIKIKQILDGRGLFVRLNQLPQEKDYRDSLSDKFYYTPFPEKMPEIYLERIDRKWYYSRETVDLIPQLFKSVFPFGADILVNILPTGMKGNLLGIASWQYLGLLIILATCVILYFLFLLGLRPVIDLLSKRVFKRKFIDRDTVFKVARLVSLMLIIWLVGMFLPAIQLPIRASEFAHKALAIIMTVFVILLGLQIVEMVSSKAREIAEQTANKMDDQALPILNRILKIILVTIGLFHILNLLDVNIAALIAGISIGGLALALAAQDTVKNLIGSMMIFFDRPFQVGDFIMGSGFEGTVDEVGFRTTRIRTVGTSVISVPNGNLANMSVENYGVRAYRILNLSLGVTYSTPPSSIEAFVEGLKKLILEQEKVADEPSYVYFRSMEDSSLNIMFRCYIDVASYAEELEVREEVLLKILRLAESEGVDFAFPSTSLYIEQNQQL